MHLGTFHSVATDGAGHIANTGSIEGSLQTLFILDSCAFFTEKFYIVGQQCCEFVLDDF